MSIDEILDEMDELLDKATAIPLAPHKKVVDGERMRELINDIRLNMPAELKEAKKIEYDCQRILGEAKENAEVVIRKAEERASQIASREAIVEEAKKKAAEILSKAQNAAANLTTQAKEDADHVTATARASATELQKQAALAAATMLKETETQYNRSLLEVQRTKEKIQKLIKNSPTFGESTPGSQE
ncbi:MAG: vacuolar-type H+-ATPase subunit H [Ruminococcus sp.]|jgi:cell division septum initiation protein DivIVA|nr:vacuolar-type H+-ATPase subunit H [Ruminococcus sp.]